MNNKIVYWSRGNLKSMWKIEVIETMASTSLVKILDPPSEKNKTIEVENKELVYYEF